MAYKGKYTNMAILVDANQQNKDSDWGQMWLYIQDLISMVLANKPLKYFRKEWRESFVSYVFGRVFKRYYDIREGNSVPVDSSLNFIKFVLPKFYADFITETMPAKDTESLNTYENTLIDERNPFHFIYDEQWIGSKRINVFLNENNRFYEKALYNKVRLVFKLRLLELYASKNFELKNDVPEFQIAQALLYKFKRELIEE